MPTKTIAFALLSLLSSSLVLACGTDDSAGADASSCDDFCDQVASHCGQSSAQCASTCAALEPSQRRCGLDANSCAAIEACLEGGAPSTPATPSGSSSSGGSSGGSSSGAAEDPCASCPLLTCTCAGELRDVRSCATGADNQVVCANNCSETSSCY